MEQDQAQIVTAAGSRGEFSARQAWVCIPAWSLVSCATLGKSALPLRAPLLGLQRSDTVSPQ